MGGDHGPSVVIPAVISALNQYPQLKVLLVGKPEALSKVLSQSRAYPKDRIDIVPASQVVEMDEHPANALRSKRDSSMRLALNLVKEKKAQGCVSAGNTGALVATARYVLKTLPGIDRPAILSKIPSIKGAVHVLDLGANVDCTAEHLYQFAIMGSILLTATMGLAQPKVGLLNIGAEDIKGTEAIKNAAELLKNNPNVNYVGFVEGDDIYKGTADVVVCDGFVGNVALKTSEGLARMMLHFAKMEFTRNWYTKFAAFLATPILKALHNRFNPCEYNGGSLLGLGGVVIKSHGSANELALVAAIRAAMIEVEKNVPQLIQDSVAQQLRGS